MSKHKVIASKAKYPVIELACYLWVVFMAGSDYLSFENPLLSISLILFNLILVYFSFYATEVSLHENELVKGDKLLFVKKRYKAERINRMAFTELSIEQNAKKYFNIVANGKTGEKITITTLPNKNPALEKMEELNKAINEFWN